MMSRAALRAGLGLMALLLLPELLPSDIRFLIFFSKFIQCC